MRISYNWIKELVPDLQASPPELADLLTSHSFETVLVGEYAVPAGIKTVRITKIEKHPNADRLRLATVTDGEKEFTVVCGAPNIEVGQVVPYSPPGAKLKDEHGEDFTVREAKIRGIVSPGMLNSLRELGLHHDQGGIWILPLDTALGRELAALVPADTILEADITPNRAHDCLSHIGIAREVAALLTLTATEPELPPLPPSENEVDGWTVTLEDSRLSPRYFGAVVENLVLAPSPLWLQARLLAAGGRPINNLVDITNYVMFEYGNPTHLFDQSQLLHPEQGRRAGKKISVRLAKRGEALTLLDETQQTLNDNDLVITADDKPVALAGVMGGQASGIADTTTHGFLEVANFNAFHIQETSRRLGLRTESSARFGKDLDPNLVTSAASRAVTLLQELAGGTVVGVLDAYPKPVTARTLSFDSARISRIAGLTIPAEQSKQILERLRFKVDASSQVTIPTDRRDIAGEHDLSEEVIRVVGLDQIPSASPKLLTTNYSLQPNLYWREIVRDTLVELGLTETYNYSFEPTAYAKVAGVADKPHLTLNNPVAPELANLRVSLLPGLLANLEKNREEFQRGVTRKESALFEVGHTYLPGEGGQVPGVIERTHLAAVVVGEQPSLESLADALKGALSLDELILTNSITPEIIAALKYRLPVFGFEINLEELLARVEQVVPAAPTLAEIKSHSVDPAKYTPLPKYPSVFRDISMLVAEVVSVEQAQEIIERIGGKLVVDVDLFDEFQPADELRKSLAFHVEYRSPDRTLTDTEVNEIHSAILAALESEIKAQVR